MPTILLVRHGQASYGGEDYDVLSELGERQAAIVGTALAERGVRPRLVATGCLQRQIGTAEIAAGPDWPAPRPDSRWDEYDADDVLGAHSSSAARLGGEGGAALSTREFQEVLDAALGDWIAAADASSARQGWPAFSEAGGGALGELVAELGRGETGVVFTSAGTISAACAGLLQLPPHAFVALNRVQVNTAVTKVVYGVSGASLLTFNEHSHLERGDRSLITFR
jgi:broad specificity phosphatase PhoE